MSSGHPPWSEEQVANLNAWQTSESVHPFTCPLHDDHRGHIMLMATPDGWRCAMQECDYRQEWAHDFMLNRRPPPNPLTRRPFPSTLRP